MTTSPVAEGERLKPCPLCGGSQLLVVSSMSYWSVLCLEWGCRCTTQGMKTRALAEAAWNRRALTE
jgi:hypothetical protein